MKRRDGHPLEPAGVFAAAIVRIEAMVDLQQPTQTVEAVATLDARLRAMRARDGKLH